MPQIAAFRFLCLACTMGGMSSTTRMSPLSRALRKPLGLLTRLGGADLTERLGLRPSAEKALFEGAKAFASVAVSGASQAKRLSSPSRLDAPRPGGVFDLTPTDEQLMIIEAVRRLADEVLRPAAQGADEACAAPPDVLARCHELGLLSMAIPEALGGGAEARSAVTFALVSIEMARGDMGLAAAALAPLAVVSALVDWGTAAQQERYLPRFAGETFTPAALALLEPRAGFDPLRPQAGAVRDGGGWKLYGDKALVPLAESAELLAVVLDVKGLGPRIFLVERGAPGVTITPEPAMGLRAAATCRVRLDGAPVGPDALLGGEDGNGFDLPLLVARSRAAWAALGVGCAQAVFDYTSVYINERKAFGELISHRQSVAFCVADMAIETEGMRLLALRAASLLDRADRGLGRAAELARLQAASKGMKIGSDGVQMLGGHGYVKEHPVERWYRDLRAVGVMEGALSL